MIEKAQKNGGTLIDIHQHIVPKVFRSLLNSKGVSGGAGEEFAAWDEETTLKVMDDNGIRTSIVSYVLSGIDINDAEFFRKLGRECNEYLAQLIGKYPGRFGGFALLPLPDVDGALEEIAYAFDQLGLDGVGMHSNMGGIYPGDERFDPVFEELNRRRAVVHLHPTDIPEFRQRSLNWPPYIVEFMFETTRAVANMVYKGTMEKYPDISIILSHSGGAAPYLAWRLWTGEFSIPGLRDAAPSGVYESLRRFYYDTAMASNPAVFGALTDLVSSSNIIFGTDYPYMPEMAIAEYYRQIEEYVGFDAAAKKAVREGNACNLFPRLKNSTGL